MELNYKISAYAIEWSYQNGLGFRFYKFTRNEFSIRFMPRYSSYRSLFFFLFLFVVVIVQIFLNLLLSYGSYCVETAPSLGQSKRDIPTIHTDILREKQRAIDALKVQLKEARTEKPNSTEIDELRRKNEELSSKLAKYEKLQKVISAQEFSKIKVDSSHTQFLKGDAVANEIEVIPFDSYTHTGIYSVNKNGLIDRPARRPIGARVKEQEEVLNFALRALRDEFPEGPIIERHNLANGISRLDRIKGFEYDLTFISGKPNEYHRVKIRRPFSNIELVDSVETLDTSKELINLVLPLNSERTDHFQVFLKRFGDICVRWDSRVHLTVVYFGKKGRDDVKNILSEFADRENFKNYKLLFEDGPFSRGVGLQKGVLSWEKGNNIMFFCDVDMFFTPDFLERCRFYTEPGQMVYYPIIFSFYNPEIVYNGRPPEIHQQLYVGKDNGFWRDFGFGMTCVYKNDFVNTRGFDTSIHGWGTEDVKLYRKFLGTNLVVIRATDRGIFHRYHSKICDFALPSEQYLSCVHSKAVNEASHTQIGMLAFGNRLFSNLEPDWKTKLEYQPDFSLRGRKAKNEEATSVLRRADELDIEIFEVKQLRKRLQTAMNFKVFGKDVFNRKWFNVTALAELQFGLQNVTQVIREMALAVDRT